MKEQLSKKAEQVSLVLKQLAHPDRLMVLCCLLDGEKTVNELVGYANASQSWVSQFLSKMKLSGLVDSQKKGVFVYYRIAEPRLKAIMTAIYKAYCVAGVRSER
ncbi:MAG: helix-turn-helix transcriptional regulator [Bdellovibrionales bacterium]|nr:helix-turn-helix transcriptional regulator [Bdellovibrionales bacterium]